MTTVQLTPLQWSNIDHIKDIDKLSAADYDCLEKIREVLAKHDRLNKFGVTLLHHHFRMRDDEILVETVDPFGRKLSSTPEDRSSIDWSTVKETLWRFGPSVGNVTAMAACPQSLTHDHSDPTPSPQPTPSVDPSPHTTPTPTPSPSPSPSPSPHR